MIFDALKPSCYRDVSEIVEVYVCLNLCLKVMYSCPSNTMFWNKVRTWNSNQPHFVNNNFFQTDHYDTTFNQLLWNLEMEQSDGARCQYLWVLIDYINSMKIRCLRFLPAVSSLLNNYITADCSVELCTKSLEVVFSEKPSCEWANCNSAGHGTIFTPLLALQGLRLHARCPVDRLQRPSPRRDVIEQPRRGHYS